LAAAQPYNKVPTISFRKDPVSADLAIAGPAVPVPGTHTHALRSVTAFLATSCASLALSTLSHYHNLKLLHIWRPAHPQGLAPYESPGVTSFFLAASLGPQFRRTAATIRGAHHFAIMSVVAQRLHMHPLISFSLASRLPAPPHSAPLSPSLFLPARPLSPCHMESDGVAAPGHCFPEERTTATLIPAVAAFTVEKNRQIGSTRLRKRIIEPNTMNTV